MVLDCAKECWHEYLTWQDRMLIPHWSSSMENSMVSSAWNLSSTFWAKQPASTSTSPKVCLFQCIWRPRNSLVCGHPRLQVRHLPQPYLGLPRSHIKPVVDQRFDDPRHLSGYNAHASLIFIVFWCIICSKIYDLTRLMRFAQAMI